MHRYCREDSRWADEGAAPVDAHAKGFEADGISICPPYVHCDLAQNELWGLEPSPAPLRVRAASEYGDDWSELLEADEVERATSYFQSIQHLSTFLDYVNLRVGGREHAIPLGKGSNRGLTFEAPRRSLVTSLRYEVFDDMLIGNFMKTTLHGRWPSTGLKPDFTPYVSKYADNGGAHSREELRAYFAEYRRQVGAFGWVYHQVRHPRRRCLPLPGRHRHSALRQRASRLLVRTPQHLTTHSEHRIRALARRRRARAPR